MRTVSTIAELRDHGDAVRARGGTVGLVPTMGYLHDGHLSLVHAARADCDEVVTTIFVNPLQFAEGEDLGTYPRDPAGDAAKAAEAGTDVLFTPPLEEMYPERVRTNVAVDVAVGFMESAARPTHFDGVATVVAKLFAMTGPCRAYFGEKDYQQLAVVRRMARDLSFPVEVVGCPVVREPDGLAMSSRNVYLTAAERAQAPALHRALCRGAEAVAGGERDVGAVRRLMVDAVADATLARLDYAEVVDPSTLDPLTRIDGPVRLLVAAGFGKARLLDNLGVTP
jgi:pantoate--beta-alanine ligase